MAKKAKKKKKQSQSLVKKKNAPENIKKNFVDMVKWAIIICAAAGITGIIYAGVRVIAGIDKLALEDTGSFNVTAEKNDAEQKEYIIPVSYTHLTLPTKIIV